MDDGAALAERLGVVPVERMLRPGTKLLHALEPDEHWTVHPSGYGIVVVRTHAPPMWVRVVDGEVVKTVVESVNG